MGAGVGPGPGVGAGVLTCPVTLAGGASVGMSSGGTVPPVKFLRSDWKLQSGFWQHGSAGSVTSWHSFGRVAYCGHLEN